MIIECHEAMGPSGESPNWSWPRNWKDWCWSWNSNTLATWCKELTHWKRPWCWERLRAGGEGDDRVWDGWMASPTQWTWVWVNSGSWSCTRRPDVLQSMGSQRIRRDWAAELNWKLFFVIVFILMFILSDISTATPAQFLLPFTWNISSTPSHSVCESL